MFLCLFGWKNDHRDSEGRRCSSQDKCTPAERNLFVHGEFIRFRDKENGSWKNCRGVEWAVLVVEQS